MITEKMKEVREWLTFVVSALTLIGVPVIALYIHNSRLETMTDVASKYVAKEEYSKDVTRSDNDRAQMQTTIGIVQGKLESIQLEQIHTSDSLAMIKEQLSNKSKP